MTKEQLIDRVFYSTTDPLNKLGINNLPAATTLLYKVCDNNSDKFAEAVRLINLFIEETLNQVKNNPEANE